MVLALTRQFKQEEAHKKAPLAVLQEKNYRPGFSGKIAPAPAAVLKLAARRLGATVFKSGCKKPHLWPRAKHWKTRP